LSLVFIVTLCRAREQESFIMELGDINKIAFKKVCGVKNYRSLFMEFELERNATRSWRWKGGKGGKLETESAFFDDYIMNGTCDKPGMDREIL
jgi:hypothetical protein